MYIDIFDCIYHYLYVYDVSVSLYIAIIVIYICPDLYRHMVAFTMKCIIMYDVFLSLSIVIIVICICQKLDIFDCIYHYLYKLVKIN